jgi:hypothetical protein
MTAEPAQPFYRRNLPHMQCDGCTIFVTYWFGGGRITRGCGLTRRCLASFSKM